MQRLRFRIRPEVPPSKRLLCAQSTPCDSGASVPTPPSEGSSVPGCCVFGPWGGPPADEHGDGRVTLKSSTRQEGVPCSQRCTSVSPLSPPWPRELNTVTRHRSVVGSWSGEDPLLTRDTSIAGVSRDVTTSPYLHRRGLEAAPRFSPFPLWRNKQNPGFPAGCCCGWEALILWGPPKAHSNKRVRNGPTGGGDSAAHRGHAGWQKPGQLSTPPLL